MQIRTFTSFWALERKLYSIYDFSLPFPISLRVLGVFIGTGIPWWLVMRLLQVPLQNGIGLIIYVAVPGGLAYFGSKPIFEGKTLFQFMRSMAQYLFENKNYKGFQPDLNKYEETIVIKHNIIIKPEPKPLPF